MLAPNAKLRALVMPRGPDEGAAAAKPVECDGMRASRPGATEFWFTMKLPALSGGSWPGRAQADFKLAAVNQSSKASQQGEF